MTKHQNIPMELQFRPQWVYWRYEYRNGRPTKVPMSEYTGQNADVKDWNTWGWIPDINAAAPGALRPDGIGFVFTKSDPYVGIDIDNCILPDGSFTEEGNRALAYFGESYHEISPSGNGLKFWIRGTLPLTTSGRKNTKKGVEVYQHTRYFTVTGKILGDQPKPILDCDAALQQFYKEYFPSHVVNGDESIDEIECPVTAAEIIEIARSEDPGFRRLFDGDRQDEFPSPSEADFALCVKIAHWAGPDPERIDEVFRQSGLYREKWDSPDYRARTIQNAIAFVANHTQGFHDWNWTPGKGFEHLLGTVDCSGLRNSPIKPSQAILLPMPGAQPASSHLIDFEFIDSGTFASKRYETKWLVKHVLKVQQPCIIAGPSKSMKTTFSVELGVSLASGLPLWNDQKYSTAPVRVALISAESGEETLQETAIRVCASKGITLESLSTNLFWAFRAPNIDAADHLYSLKEFMLRNGINVILIDPAYLSMGNIGDSVNNQFAVGAVLQKLSWLMQETGATVVLAAHTGKGIRAGKELELSDIAHAGFCQWARQWILVNRRVAYDAANPGSHQLYVSYGGSAGHSGSWSVDISEGRIEEGRTWSYSVRNTSEVRSVNPPGMAQSTAVQGLQQEIMAVMADTPMVISRIAELVKSSRNAKGFVAALTELVETGQVCCTEIPRNGNAAPIRSYSRAAIDPANTEAET